MSSVLVSVARRAAIGLLVALLAATTSLLDPTAATSAAPQRTALGTAAGANRVHTWSVRVQRGGPDVTITFHRSRVGQAFVVATVAARGVSWAEPRNESAVVSVFVDGHYATDVVITSSGPVRREFALGSLGIGRHRLRLHYASDRSPSRAGVATLKNLRFRTLAAGSPGYLAARYAPVLYGRNLIAAGGKFANNRTDTPLVAWHQVLPATRTGHSVIEYSVIWSNEDGGTNTPALMAQWGRSTDIEWIYRVEVDAAGRRVRGTGVYQAPGHQTLPFKGRYDGTHPLLQTCTSNNNVCDHVDDPMRFALSTRNVLPGGQPREHEMDTHPWTYQVMAREMVREGKIESPSDPATPAVGDQRSYLYVAVDHDTEPASSASGIGLVVEVRLVGDATTYTSNHGVVFWAINRDGPAATTVELPVGTTPADVESISVRRVPLATDDGAALEVTRVIRAFFLRSSYLPAPSFASWHGSVSLTAGSPTAQLWPAP